MQHFCSLESKIDNYEIKRSSIDSEEILKAKEIISNYLREIKTLGSKHIKEYLDENLEYLNEKELYNQLNKYNVFYFPDNI